MKMKLRVVEDMIFIFMSGLVLGAGWDLMIYDRILKWKYSIIQGSVWGTIIVSLAILDIVMWGIEFHKDVNYLQEGQ